MKRTWWLGPFCLLLFARVTFCKDFAKPLYTNEAGRVCGSKATELEKQLDVLRTAYCDFHEYLQLPDQPSAVEQPWDFAIYRQQLGTTSDEFAALENADFNTLLMHAFAIYAQDPAARAKIDELMHQVRWRLREELAEQGQGRKIQNFVSRATLYSMTVLMVFQAGRVLRREVFGMKLGLQPRLITGPPPLWYRVLRAATLGSAAAFGQEWFEHLRAQKLDPKIFGLLAKAYLVHQYRTQLLVAKMDRSAHPHSPIALRFAKRADALLAELKQLEDSEPVLKNLYTDFLKQTAIRGLGVSHLPPEISTILLRHQIATFAHEVLASQSAPEH